MTFEIEDLEIRDFLRGCPPLRRLRDKHLDRVTESIVASYARRDTVILEPDTFNDKFYLIRSGAAEVYTPDETLHAHVAEAEWFGYRSAMTGGNVVMRVKAIEDCLLYQIPHDVMDSLCTDYPTMKHFFSGKKTVRLQEALSRMRESGPGINMIPVKDLMRDPIEVAPDASIQDGAKVMAEHGRSLVLIREDDKLKGLVTDLDLRARVVAQGMDIQQPIRNIMTADPVTLNKKAVVSDALILMAQHNIHKLPIVDNDQVIGVLSSRDVVRAQSGNVVFLVGEIRRATRLSKLQHFASSVTGLLLTLVRQNLSSNDISRAISTIGESINIRLLELGEKKFGPPPVPYAWGIAGSMARCEQIAHSDQDSALILSDDYREEEHGEYFRQLTQYVSDGMHACGYVYCPGDVMATNPKWHVTASQWMKYFQDWVTKPEPKALMYSSIFFDMRVLYGDASLFEPIKQWVTEQAPKNSIFLSYMVANSLQHRPPLGFFRNFVLEDHGVHEDELNLKQRGVIPVVDLARAYSLASGVQEVNTVARLESSKQKGGLSKEGLEDLMDAYEIINSIRLEFQARDIENGQDPDHYVSPELLSSIEQRHLKDAFDAVKTMQEAIARAYQVDSL